MPNSMPTSALSISTKFFAAAWHKRLADDAIAQLSDQQFFAVIDRESNSVAIVVKHMAGNMRSRFSDFLTTTARSRPQSRPRISHAQRCQTREILASWEQNWQLVFEAVNSLHPADSNARSPSAASRTPCCRPLTAPSPIVPTTPGKSRFWRNTGRARSGSRSASPRARANSSTPRCCRSTRAAPESD